MAPLLVATAMLFTLGSGIANAAPAAVPESGAGSHYAWMTPEQYAALQASPAGFAAAYQASAATSATSDDSSQLSTSAAAVNPLTIFHDYRDLNGTSTPLRYGNSSAFGFLHYSTSHNLASTKPIASAFQSHGPTRSSGAHYEYDDDLVDTSNGNKVVIITVVVQAADHTDDRVYKATDGKNIGVITAYCKGYNRCPDFVNRV